MGDKTERGRPAKDASARPTRKTSSGAEAFIARQLKAMYEDVVAQPIPERLLELLNRLDGGSDKK
jgi:hypothetical protein